MDNLDFSAKKKNQDNMDLLLSYPAFQADVRKIRAEFDIPEKTFAKDEHAAEAWTITLGSTRGKAARFAKALAGLVDNYRLPGNYVEYLKRHIIYGTTNAPLNNFAVIPFSREDYPEGPRYLTIEVYAHLTQDEESDLRKEVSRLGKTLPVFSPLKDIKRKIEREQRALEVQDYNQNSRLKVDRPTTYGEVLSDKRGTKKEGAKARENLRELDDHRTKRFGKK